MDATEIRLRLIEAAARTPAAASQSADETARRVLEMVRAWETHVLPAQHPGQADNRKIPQSEIKERERAVLGLPK